MVAAMESSDYDWVSCQHYRYDEAGNRLEKQFDFVSGEFSFLSDDDRFSFMTRTLLCYHMGFEVWNKLYKADVINNGDIRFPENCKVGEDLAFNLKYLMCADNIKCIPDRLVRYTSRDDSAMGRISDLATKIAEHSLILEDVWSYITAKNDHFWIRKFPCIFVKILDNAYAEHTPVEATKALLSIGDLSFIKKRYESINFSKKEIRSLYPVEEAKLKYRYHLYVRQAIDDRYVFDRLKLLVYHIYRKTRGFQALKEWKMTY
jgi:hypothetical protein